MPVQHDTDGLPDGKTIFGAFSDGNVLLYSDTLHTFTTSRHDVSLQTGLTRRRTQAIRDRQQPAELVAGSDQGARFGSESDFGFRVCEWSGVPDDLRSRSASPPPTFVTECVFGGEICVTKSCRARVSLPFLRRVTPGSIQW